jgi:hypothetical protein
MDTSAEIGVQNSSVKARTDPVGGHEAAGRVSTMRCGSVASTDARSDSMRDTEFSSAVPSAMPRTHCLSPTGRADKIRTYLNE